MDVLAWPTRKYDSGSNHLVCLPCMQTCLARFALEHSKVDLLFSGFRPFLKQFSNRSKLMSTQTLKPHKVPPKVRHTTQWRAFLFKSSGKSTECTPRPIHTKKYSKSWESWVTPPWLLSTYYGQLDISRGSLAAPVLREFGAHLVGNDAAPVKFSIDIELIIQAGNKNIW